MLDEDFDGIFQDDEEEKKKVGFTFPPFFWAVLVPDSETRIMLTCMSTSRSNYFDMSIWKKHADHNTSYW